MPGICMFTNINNTIIVGESSLGGKKREVLWSLQIGLGNTVYYIVY